MCPRCYIFRDDYWRGGLYECIVPTVMSRDRFKQIWRFLHLADNTVNDARDKLFKDRSYINHLTNKFKTNIIPNGFFSLDESMVKWKGRLSWRQFMPAKPIRFGMKLWSLYESSTGYLFNVQVYTGKEAGRAEQNLSFRVVTDLITCMYFTNARLCFDNFYTGLPLLEHLRKNGVFAWGTVRKNRKGLPANDFFNQALAKHSFRLSQQNEFLCVTWKDTKPVNFCLTSISQQKKAK